MPAGKNKGSIGREKLNKIQKTKDAFDAEAEASREFLKTKLDQSCCPECDE